MRAHMATDEGVISFAEMPPLQEAMTRFIEQHPNWDQYHFMQAALSSRTALNPEITRLCGQQ